MKYLKFFFFAIAISAFVWACVDDDDYDVPAIICEELTPNGTLQDILALTPEDTLFLEGTDTIFEGYVVSSDEQGNFFKTLSVQNALSGATAGIQIDLDLNDLYTYFPVGSKVFVKADGFYLGTDRGAVKLGGVFISNGEARVGRLNSTQVLEQVFASCDEPAEITPNAFNRIDDNLFNSANINTLVKLDSVQFVNAGNGETYYDAENDLGGATNVAIEDADGNRIFLRTSSFADFASEELPTGSGSIVGVLGVFDSQEDGVTNSEYQLFIRDLNDIQLDNPRILEQCDPFSIGSESLPFVEDWNTYVDPNDTSIAAPWVTYAQEGDELFVINSFDGVNNADMSAFGSDDSEVITWLISPTVDMNEATDPVMSFRMADAFQNGVPLELLYSTDFDGSNCPQNFTWTEIAENEIAALFNNDGFFDNIYEFSGNIDLSAISGEVIFAFRYTGGEDDITSTVQLSEITIGEMVDAGGGGGGGSGDQINISDIRALFSGSSTTINQDGFIQGVVTSDRSNGSITGRNLFIQDNTAGIVVRFSADHTFNIGDELQVPVNGIELSDFNGLVQLNNVDLASAQIVSTGNNVTPAVVTISDILTGNYEAQLVQINNIQYQTPGVAFEGEQIITDGTNTLPMFVRGAFEDLTSKFTPSGNETIVVHASTFNGVQVLPRDPDEVGAVDSGGGGGGGTAGIPLLETFDSGIPSSWEVVTDNNDAEWEGRSFSGEFYARMSAFAGSGNPITDVRTWLITPQLNFDAQTGETMVLEIADAFFNGQPLKAYYSNDYNGNGNPESFTWTEIGMDEIEALNDNSMSYDNIYEATDPIDLSGITGQAYIAFVYDSAGGTISTTIDLSNVDIQ